MEKSDRPPTNLCARREGLDVDRFLGEFDHPWLCHQRLFDQIDFALQRIGREESYYDRQQSLEDAKGGANQMRYVYDTCIDALTNWVNGMAPATVLRKNPEAATILHNTCDVLGKQTPVKVWLAVAFRKKMALFREHDLEETLSV